MKSETKQKQEEKAALIVRSVVVCDDVRREISGKEILIGVYSGDIVSSRFPAALPLSIWIEHDTTKIGAIPVEIRVVTGGGTELFGASFTLTIEQLDAQGSFFFGFPIVLTDPGLFSIELRQHGGEWVKIKTKRIVKAPTAEAGASTRA